jgi:hypothetical protein
MKVFDNLKFQQIKKLIEIINETKEKNIEIIKNRYKNSSDNFEGAKEFLNKLKIIKGKNKILTLNAIYQQFNNENFSDDSLKQLLLNELLTTKSVISKDIRNYFNNFTVNDNMFEYTPTMTSRVKESEIRNFFMELGLIEYKKSTGAYIIKPKYFDKIENYLDFKKMSPQELALAIKKRDDLGKAAELKVLQYEKDRLSDFPELLKKIKHISMSDVLAGYDILSWEKNKAIPRFIEVKAISKNDYNFFWTRNEIEKAKELTNRYYLYLLPVIDNNKFDINSLEIISNPINKVFLNAKEWRQQVETYKFFKLFK